MRSVCSSDFVELQLHGNIYQNAIALGDVDNDGKVELIIGNMEGALFVFKEMEKIQTVEKLGLITAIGVADIMNCGSNALVVVSGDGWCHIFLYLSKPTEENECENVKLEAVHVQRIPANTKTILLGDIDRDGNIELVLGLTDRVVRSYRWTQNFSGGKLLCLNKWECANQIGNLALHHDLQNRPIILISQPGGTLMRITCFCDKDRGEKSVVDYQPLSYKRMRNKAISCDIIGNIRVDDSDKNGLTYALATLDGMIILVRDEKILWSSQMDQGIFAMSKLKVCDGEEEQIVTCSWNGDTHILDQDRNCVKFITERAVSGFCAGLYTLNADQGPTPCFIYTTFTGKVYIYYGIHFPRIKSDNALLCATKDSDAAAIFNKFGSREERRLFISRCLYDKLHISK